MKKATRIILVFLVLVLIGTAGCSIVKKDPSQSSEDVVDNRIAQEEIESFVDLVNNYTHYDPDFVVYSESDEPVVPVKNVDYVPKDVKRAVADHYKSMGNPPAENEHISRNTDIGPAAWVSIGEKIVSSIAEKKSEFKDSGLHKLWSDPNYWVSTGDSVVQEIFETVFAEESADEVIRIAVEKITADAEDSDFDIDTEEITSVIEDEVAEHLEEEWKDIESEEDLVEYVEVYFDDSWKEFREEPKEENIPLDTVVDTLRNRKVSEKTDDRGIIKAEYYPVSFKPTGRLFYRNTLNEKEKRAYDIVVSMLQNGIFEIECNFGMTQGELYEVLHCVKRDFPEFFYLSFGHVYYEKEAVGFTVFIDERIKKIGIDAALDTLKSKTAPAIAEAAKLEKEIDKVKHIVDHMCATIMYDPFTGLSEAETEKRISAHQTLWTAVSEGKTVCAGYAQLFHYYMKMLGISCTKLVTQGHALNLLELDGECYYTDVTWIDGGGYRWFNYNDKLKELYKALRVAPEGWADRDYLSSKLPAANGSKYFYGNYYEKDILDEDGNYKDKSAKPKDFEPSSAKVKVNGFDMSGVKFMTYEDVLYAEGSGFIEGLKSSDGKKLFRFAHDSNGDNPSEAHVYKNDGNFKEFILPAYAMYMHMYWRNPKMPDQMVMDDVTRIKDRTFYIPVIAFLKTITKAGYGSELVIDGNSYSFKALPVDRNGSETTTESADNTDPAATTDPAKATEPAKTAEPTNTTEPTRTAEPTNTTEPTRTAEPTNAIEPTKPTEPAGATRPPNGSAYTVIIDGVDISEDLEIIEVDNKLYAEGKSFIEIIRYSDMPKGMRVFNYEYVAGGEENYNLLSEYSYESGHYLRDEFKEFLNLDTIVIYSYITDTTCYMLFIGSEKAVEFIPADSTFYPELITLSAAPVVIDGDIYVPIEAFLAIAGIGFELD